MTSSIGDLFLYGAIGGAGLFLFVLAYVSLEESANKRRAGRE